MRSDRTATTHDYRYSSCSRVGWKRWGLGAGRSRCPNHPTVKLPRALSKGIILGVTQLGGLEGFALQRTLFSAQVWRLAATPGRKRSFSGACGPRTPTKTPTAYVLNLSAGPCAAKGTATLAFSIRFVNLFHGSQARSCPGGIAALVESISKLQ